MTGAEGSLQSSRPVAAYLGATGLSLLGNALIAVILPWIVLQRHGVSTAALVAAATGLPTAAGAVLGGWMVDRWGLRPISVCADLLSGASVATMVVIDVATGLTPGWFIALAAAGAVLDIPGASAREALISEVASASATSLERLAGLRGGLFGAAFLLGPPAAGLLLGVIPDMLLLLCVAALSAGAAWIGAHVPDAKPSPVPQAGRPHMAAWKTIVEDAALRHLLVIAVATALVSRPVVTLLLPAHFQSVGSSTQLGLTLAAYAAGTTVGSGIFAKYGHLSRPQWWVGANLASAVCLAIAGCLPSTAWLAATMATLGVAGAPVQSLTTVLLADHTPIHRRGGVFTLFASAGLLAAPLALAVASILLRYVDPDQLAGAACAAWALVCLGSVAMAHHLRELPASRCPGRL